MLAINVIKTKRAKFLLKLLSPLTLLSLLIIYLTLRVTIVPKTLRVAFPRDKEIYYYDPANIRYLSQYILTENLFSTLVYYNIHGELVSGLAEKFYWEGNEAYFKIRNDLKTIDGREITARDVETTFKRLAILGTNTHGNIKNILCGDKQINKLSDNCPNLRLKNDYLISISFKKKNPFLFSMLTATDFGIVPIGSIDNRTLAIKDYRNTSGPYFVDQYDNKGFFILSANKTNFLYSKDMPQKIEIIPSRINNKSISLELFKGNKVDMITTLDDSSELLRYAENNPKINLFKTVSMQLSAITFTPSAVTKFSRKERFIIAKKIKESVLPHLLKRAGAEETAQIFPTFGQGALYGHQLKILDEEMEKAAKSSFNKRIVAWNIPEVSIPDLKKALPSIEVKQINGLPGHIDYLKDGLKEPDLFFRESDTSVKEDINFFYYYMNNYFFVINGKDGNRWIDKYSQIENYYERMKMINDLHYQTLKEAITIPLVITPYVALSNKNWKFDFLNLHAGTTFWRLKWNWLTGF